MLATKPPNDGIAALRKARELATVINHSIQLFDKLKRIQTMNDENRNAVGIIKDVIGGSQLNFCSIECSG
jgi:hypothetical protein